MTTNSAHNLLLTPLSHIFVTHSTLLRSDISLNAVHYITLFVTANIVNDIKTKVLSTQEAVTMAKLCV